jgi:hypothetical protein
MRRALATGLAALALAGATSAGTTTAYGSDETVAVAFDANAHRMAPVFKAGNAAARRGDVVGVMAYGRRLAKVALAEDARLQAAIDGSESDFMVAAAQDWHRALMVYANAGRAYAHFNLHKGDVATANAKVWLMRVRDHLLSGQA